MGRAVGNLFVALAMAPAGAACSLDVDFGQARFHCSSAADCPDGDACVHGYCARAGSPGDDEADEGNQDAATGTELLVFLPTRDAYVDSDEPNLNRGEIPELRADGDPVVTSYIDFAQAGLADIGERRDILSVRLELYSLETHSGYQVWLVDGPWNETGLTFANAPPFGTALGTSGPLSGGSWSSVDLAGATSDGALESFAVTTVADNALSLASREAEDLTPRLVYVVAAE